MPLAEVVLHVLALPPLRAAIAWVATDRSSSPSAEHCTSADCWSFGHAWYTVKPVFVRLVIACVQVADTGPFAPVVVVSYLRVTIVAGIQNVDLHRSVEGSHCPGSFAMHG